MKTSTKIILIVVSVLVAIGAAIGIYFAVKNKNPYTKAQQDFINDIIDSNKPSKPPVDIGGGSLPGGVVGEDSDGDKVIVDTGDGEEIWEKDPTNPDGEYKPVPMPDTDDEGETFLYTKIVQVCGNFALVQNDVGNHAVVNLAETKVVLNYTDLQDAENLHMAGDVLFYTTPYYLEEVALESEDVYHVHFTSLLQAKQDGVVQELNTEIKNDCVYKIIWINSSMIAIQGMENFQIFKCTEGSMQVIYEVLDTEFLTYIKNLAESDEDDDVLYSHVVIGNALYKENISISISKLNNQVFFINKITKYDTYQSNIPCFYTETTGFTGYLAPEYFILNADGTLKNLGSKNEVFVPQNCAYDKYITLLKYEIINDDVKFKIISTEKASFQYYTNNMQFVMSTSFDAGVIVDFDESKNLFVAKNGSYSYVNAKGEILEIVKDATITYYNANSNIFGGFSSVSTYAVFTKNGQQITEFMYKTLFGPQNNVIVGERHELVYDEITESYVDEIYYDFINSSGVYASVAYDDIAFTELLNEGICILKQEDFYVIKNFAGENIATNVQNVQVILQNSTYIISYEKDNAHYSFKIVESLDSFINTAPQGSGISSLAALGWMGVEPTTANFKNITASYRENSVKKQTEQIKKEHRSSQSLSLSGLKLQINNISKESVYYYGHEAIIKPEEGYFIRGYAETYRDFALNWDAVIIGNEDHEYFNLDDSSATFTVTGDKSYFKYVGVYYWYQIAYNTFRVYLQGGEGSTSFRSSSMQSDNQMQNGDTGVKIEPPTKRGYVFRGYYTATDGKGDKIFNEDGSLNGTYVTNKGGNKNLYAYWEPLKTQVTFIGFNQSSFAEYTFNQALTQSGITAAVKKGYEFQGWYTQENGKGLQIFNKDNAPMVVSNYIRKGSGTYYWDRDYNYQNASENKITLYAYYTPKDMRVTLNVVADPTASGINVDEIQKFVLGNNASSATYKYDSSFTNSIKLTMTQTKYYIKSFSITAKTFDNSNALNIADTKTSREFTGVVDSNNINNNVLQIDKDTDQNLYVVPNKAVNGNEATYTFNFKTGTSVTDGFVNTWQIELTVVIGLDLSVTPPKNLAFVQHISLQMPAVLPQNKKEVQ